MLHNFLFSVALDVPDALPKDNGTETETEDKDTSKSYCYWFIFHRLLSGCWV